MNVIRGAIGVVFAALFPVNAGAAIHKKTRSVTASPSVSDTGDLGYGDLLSISLIALKKHVDQFSTDPTNKYDGRRFKIIQPVRDGSTGDGLYDSTWRYVQERQVITFSMQQSHDYQIQLFYKNTPKGSFIGQTAMGVRFRIAKSEGTDIHFSTMSDGPVKLGKYAKSFEVTVPADPQLGRQLSQDVVLEVDGRLYKTTNGVANCHSEDLTASLDDPTEEIRLTCELNAKIDRVAFVRRSSGVVLKELSAISESDQH